MTLRELFPRYPLILKTPPRSRIKFGTHRLYVDFPWQTCHFMVKEMEMSAESDLTAEGVSRKWHNFLQDNKQFLIFQNKPLASAYLWDAPFTHKKSLVLRIKWSFFLEYLEEKAQNFTLEVEKDGKSIRKLYMEIWLNFFSLVGELEAPESFYFHGRENFMKLLKRTGDYSYLEVLLTRFESTIHQIEDYAKNKGIHAAQLYTANFLMDIRHLHALIDVLSIPPAYLLMRNILENFVKFSVYLNMGKSINDPNLVLSAMFLYEYEADRRRYSLGEFKKEFRRKFLKIKDTFFSDEVLDSEVLDIPELVRKFKEKGMPILGVNPKVLEEFSANYGLNKPNLDIWYSACSEVIHNQPPLPFFSLLEVKFFKHFLEKNIKTLQVIAEKIIDGHLEMEEISIHPFFEERNSLKECLHVAYLLETENGAEIKDLIKRAMITLQEGQNENTEPSAIWIRPLTLISLFHLISPSLRHLRDFSFVEEDIGDIIEKLQPLSFKGSLKDEIEVTLSKLQDVMLPELERYRVFSSLSSEKKRKVIFYLLIDNLSKTFEGTLSS
uniref:Uncharacterized protein n=1 Tax=Candidatus Methanophagaceae archaeon ANME-1 ERB6 TaxID=2759912 RepID=A0A7G9YTR2_9EURY|nr:hypothetical protein KMJFBAND_00033 [Methanosarcinales archaeon ANME-1 ERB6]